MNSVTLALVLVAFGVLTGALAGVLGVGGGIMIVPFLALALGMPEHAAQATSLLVILPTAVVASVSLNHRGVGDLHVSLPVGLVGTFGAVGGALLASRLPTAALRIIFALVLVTVGIRLIRDALRPSVASAGVGPAGKVPAAEATSE
jgi:uncharacterized membrane protein YfcA